MSAVNGLELKTPEDAGYQEFDAAGHKVLAVIMNGKDTIGAAWSLERGKTVGDAYSLLVPLPKPKTYRPYKRGEVRLGWMFRRKTTGQDYLTTSLMGNRVMLGEEGFTADYLLEHFHHLTYDASGQEVLSTAGVEE